MVAIANVEMAKMWADEADEWITNADRYDATDHWINERFEAETVIRSRDRVLDIGCGTGKSSRAAAYRAHDGSVLGVDLSSRMLDDARRRSADEGLTNVEFLLADAQVHPFDPGSFDVAISVFGAMFFADPLAAFTNIRRSLHPGGHIAFLAWQRFEHNEWLTTLFDALAAGRDVPAPAAGAPGPFGLADAEAVTTLLREAGFVDAHMTSISAPIWLGATATEAWAFVTEMGFVRGITDGLDDQSREQALNELHRRLLANERADGVLLASAAWLITARHP